ncbi:MAG: ADP-ribose pyrophosphatase [uncultured archaeon A07HR60]|jgi:NUDIX domain.|nr:MAG: ADP-ribose pyrophosphatase [Halorubrum sp. J07HR59]ESS12277.1 MAG: ADP-ribose pyrophosphatase [uncultured archaeon A07HR60]
METTRHFTATTYIVHDGATALHHHDRLGIQLPPGGHVDRDELPHETAIRETLEETGLEPTLASPTTAVTGPNSRGIPEPNHLMLHDINTHPDGSVGHQHIDHLYYASVSSRQIDPGPGEAPSDSWDWHTPEELRNAGSLSQDVVALGLEAIKHIESAD